MYRLAPNFGVRPAAVKNFYFRLAIEKMGAFAVFTEKYLRPNGWSGSKFSTAVNCTNSKIEVQSKIIETQIIEVQIQHVRKQIFLLCEQNLIHLVINCWLLQLLSLKEMLKKYIIRNSAQVNIFTLRNNKGTKPWGKRPWKTMAFTFKFCQVPSFWFHRQP